MFVSRRIAVGVVVALALGCGGYFAFRWSLQQAPDFYEEALTAKPAPEVQQAAAQTFVERTLSLVEELRHTGEWAEEFSQQQVNGWIAENLQKRYPHLLKGVEDPRVHFGDGTVEIAFRLDNDAWKGIVSFRVRPRIDGPNQLALEVESVRAGLLPLPLDTVYRRIKKKFDLEGWHVRSKHTNGADVIYVQLDPNRDDGPILEMIEVIDGALKVAGTRKQPPRRPVRTASYIEETPRLAKVIRTAALQTEQN